MGTVIERQIRTPAENLEFEKSGTAGIQQPLDPNWPVLGPFWGGYYSKIKGAISRWLVERFPVVEQRPRSLYAEAGESPDAIIDRIWRLVERDDEGLESPERAFVMETTQMCMVFGAVTGYLKGIKGVKENFQRIHAATIFHNPQEAKRQLMNVLLRKGVKGAFKGSLRLAFLSFVASSTVVTVATVRGKSGILEYSSAGALAGFLYRLPRGPRAQLGATAAGGALGAVGGTLIFGISRLTGTTREELNEWTREQMRMKAKASQSRRTPHESRADMEQHDEMWEAVRGELIARGVVDASAMDGPFQLPTIRSAALVSRANQEDLQPTRTADIVVAEPQATTTTTQPGLNLVDKLAQPVRLSS